MRFRKRRYYILKIIKKYFLYYLCGIYGIHDAVGHMPSGNMRRGSITVRGLIIKKDVGFKSAQEFSLLHPA